LRAALAALILATLGCAGPAPPRILVLGFDGLDPNAVDLLMSEGRLPHFARLRLEGAYGRLATFKPTLSPILWTTIATGKTPDQHGIGHFVAVDPETGRDQPVTSDLRRVKALWNLFSEAGRKVGVLGWWASYPPERVNGFVASDRLAWHFLFAQGFEETAAPGATWPADLEERLRPEMTRPDQIGAADLAPFVDVDAADLDRPFDLEDDLQHFRWVLATMRSYHDVGLDLWKSERPDLMMAYFEGTDSTAHLFGHLFREHGLAGELAEQQRKFGHAVESVYVEADRILGDFLAAVDDDTTVMVLSDHGFELGVLPDDPSRLRDMRRVSERFHRDHGVLYLWGAHVRPDTRIQDANLLDIAPTLMGLAGIAPARDMPGRFLSEAFVDVAEPERVATYESGAKAPAAATHGDAAADAALLEHLKSLGYLSGSSPKGDRNLAAVSFEQGDYRKAAQLYKALVDQEPDDAGLRASFAGALGALGRYEEALAQLDASIRLDPLNPEAYHNRGAALERLGRARAAPEGEDAQRATALAQEAQDLARRGAYAEALGRLAAAQRLAPRLTLVCQYESNVAYLAGDKKRAIAALERCLGLEPDNALFRVNLDRLRSGT